MHADDTLGLRLDALGERVLLEVVRLHEGLQVLVLDLPEAERDQESRAPDSLQIEQGELGEDEQEVEGAEVGVRLQGEHIRRVATHVER